MVRRAEPVAKEGLIRPGLRRETGRRREVGRQSPSPPPGFFLCNLCAKSIEKRPHFVFISEEGQGRDAGLGAQVNSQMRAAGQGPKRNRDAGGSRSHQKRLHPKARHFSEPTLLAELERRAASGTGRLRGRMGRPHLEDPGPRGEPGLRPGKRPRW